MQQLLRQIHTIGELQRYLLPRELPEPAGWRLAVHYAVGRWPGGDYYDFLPIAGGRLILLFADASDEGGPSTVLVALLRSLIRSCPLSSGTERLPFCPLQDSIVQPPHVVLGHANNVLYENSLAEQFMTAFYGVLHVVDGTLHYANAAYPAPRWWRASRGALEAVREASGLPLGLARHVSYSHRRIDVQPGDLLVFNSDGVTGAQDHKGNCFGCERLDEAMREAAPDGAEAVKAAVLDRMQQFLGGKPPQDDMTLVVVERMN
jgi:sigma-B regulation protein RsbU (phosphoserine phosphatase)